MMCYLNMFTNSDNDCAYHERTWLYPYWKSLAWSLRTGQTSWFSWKYRTFFKRARSGLRATSSHRFRTELLNRTLRREKKLINYRFCQHPAKNQEPGTCREHREQAWGSRETAQHEMSWEQKLSSGGLSLMVQNSSAICPERGITAERFNLWRAGADYNRLLVEKSDPVVTLHQVHTK